MISACLSHTGFLSIEFRPQAQKYGLQFVIETVLPSIGTILLVCRPKVKTRAARMHIDNTKTQNSRLSIRKMEECGFICIPQTPDAPELAPYDFFMFGDRKFQLESKTFLDEDDLKKQVTRMLTEVLILCSVPSWTSELKG
jgi:hypothetical protein